MISSASALLACSTVLCGSLLWAQTVAEAQTPGTNPATPASLPAAHSTAAPQIGSDRPVVVVPATTDEVTVRVWLRGLEGTPQAADIEAGLLTSAQQPNLLLRPSVTLLTAVPVPGKAGDFTVELSIWGLVVFGDSSAPLLYKGKQVESLRFSKPGLLVKPAGDGGLVAREGSKLSLELVNLSTFEYKAVRARLRFADQDVCVFDAEKFGKPPTSDGARQSCDTFENWTPFDLPKYAQATLRADPATSWFVDPDTGRARSGKRKGSLTLRFQAAPNGPIHEQSLPLDIQFEPGSWSLFRSLLAVAGCLLAGAVISLLLRVSVPNIKRKKQLKDQLNDAAKLTASISTEVDSNLRVLLRVERLALDQIRMAVWSLGPGYADYAHRVEQGLPSLLRRVDAVRGLDAALTRTRVLAEQGVAPTRLEQIETLAATVSETLKQDTLSDEDWVFVNQRLETIQKTLREPTQTEKEAFEALLAGRWRMLREHFGVDDNGTLKVPAALHGMEACFPDRSLLPAADEGTKWIQSVGPVRADLQLSALGLLSEYQFLAPTVEPAGPWAHAQAELTRLLATPAIDNLRKAKSILRQLAEGIAEENILTALREGNATVVMDPAIPRPNQKIRFSVRFRVANLNTAAARDLVACRWTFRDRHLSTYQKAKRGVLDSRWYFSKPGSSPTAQQSVDFLVTTLSEDGWHVHHYFEEDVAETEVSVAFHDSLGQPLTLGTTEAGTTAVPWARLTESLRQSRHSEEKWGRASLELFQLTAALLIPLATLASTTINGGSAGHWWELIAIGFGSDTIKNILVGRQE